jgi:hypothetical protein
MKYLKKYNESIKTLDSLSNEELEEKLEWLRVEQKEIQEEILNVNKILTKRKEEEQSKYSKSLPESIFDFNKEQLEWVFEHHHGTTSEHYKIAQKYLSQLKGVHQVGFNQNTNQFYFNISSSYFMNDVEDEFLLKEEGLKSIQFLSENLKKHDDYVEFGVTYAFTEDYNDKVQIGDDIKYGGYSKTKMDSIEKVLEAIVSNDLYSKDDVSDW